MPTHVVVDGSNLATEGRALPSLKQLNEAVLAYMEEHPDDVITVVVDATFGHRIDPREVPEFDAAVENNELVAPPAGAIGRGDAFVLTIANKVDATIISNDSYQEFHGDYPWLFDEGRLIGGKPVPNVGWIFVPRVPVRGPVSRRAVKDAKKASKAATRETAEPRRARASKEASRPMPVPTAPPPGLRAKASTDKHATTRHSSEKRSDKHAGAKQAAASEVDEGQRDALKPGAPTDAPAAQRQHMVNELLPFLGFVEQHPVGTTVGAEVESYSSHGAYVTVGDARAYVPLRLMAEPPPRSARTVLKLGDTVDLVVVSFNATRRSIDLCVPGMEPPEVRELMAATAAGAKPAKRSRKKAAAAAPAVPEPTLVDAEPAAPAKRSRKKKAAAAEATPAPAPEATPAPAAKRGRKKAAATASGAAVEPIVAVDAVHAAPAPEAAPVPVKRSRKKAAAAAPTAEAEAPTPAPAAPAKRTRKKAATPSQ